MVTLEALTPYLVLFLGTVLVPTAGFLVRTAFSVRSRLDTHEATDAIVFRNLSESLADLKSGQEKQDAVQERLDAKLDRLIERAHR